MNSSSQNNAATSHSDDLPDSSIARIESGEMFENDPSRDKKLPRRRLARERVMQMLYAKEMNGIDIDTLFRDMVLKELHDDEQALEFAKELTFQISAHEAETKQLLTDRLKHWDFSRIALIDRILIEIGITELRYFPEIPPKATINELIEIAKDYSTDDSGKFINGLLHAVMTQLTESGDLNKTGRGLIDRTM